VDRIPQRWNTNRVRLPDPSAARGDRFEWLVVDDSVPGRESTGDDRRVGWIRERREDAANGQGDGAPLGQLVENGRGPPLVTIDVRAQAVDRYENHMVGERLAAGSGVHDRGVND